MSERFINDSNDEYEIIRDRVTGEIWNLEGCRQLLNEYAKEILRYKQKYELMKHRGNDKKRRLIDCQKEVKRLNEAVALKDNYIFGIDENNKDLLSKVNEYEDRIKELEEELRLALN